MLPEFPVEAGVPSKVHPASAAAAVTTVDVSIARARNRERSIGWSRTLAPNLLLSNRDRSGSSAKTWVGPGPGPTKQQLPIRLENKALTLAELMSSCASEHSSGPSYELDEVHHAAPARRYGAGQDHWG